jgi:hypothetical protein
MQAPSFVGQHFASTELAILWSFAPANQPLTASAQEHRLSPRERAGTAGALTVRSGPGHAPMGPQPVVMASKHHEMPAREAWRF